MTQFIKQHESEISRTLQIASLINLITSVYLIIINRPNIMKWLISANYQELQLFFDHPKELLIYNLIMSFFMILSLTMLYCTIFHLKNNVKNTSIMIFNSLTITMLINCQNLFTVMILMLILLLGTALILIFSD